MSKRITIIIILVLSKVDLVHFSGALFLKEEENARWWLVIANVFVASQTTRFPKNMW
jgi:hypothetical protein